MRPQYDTFISFHDLNDTLRPESIIANLLCQFTMMRRNAAKEVLFNVVLEVKIILGLNRAGQLSNRSTSRIARSHCSRREHDSPARKLKEEETRKELLVHELESLVKRGSLSELDESRLQRDLRQRVSDTKALLARHKAQARQVLRELLEQPLTFVQSFESGKEGYKVTGQGSLLKLLPDQLATPCVVSPTGFEPVLPA